MIVGCFGANASSRQPSGRMTKRPLHRAIERSHSPHATSGRPPEPWHHHHCRCCRCCYPQAQLLSHPHQQHASTQPHLAAMSHILRRLGEAALQFRQVGPNRFLPPILSRRRAMVLRKEWLAEGKEWPYEHIVPGLPKNDPPFNGGKQKGHKRHATREERQRKIEAAMAKMPQLIADYKASRMIPWDQVSPADKLLLTTRQIREKYVYKKLR